MILILFALLFAGNAAAVPLQWERPIERESGDAFEVTEISEYRMYQTGAEMVVLSVGAWGIPELEGIDWQPSTDEPHCMRMTVVDLEGRESALSNEVCINYNPSPPGISCQ